MVKLWNEVVVDLGAAVICFMSTCFPALVGKDTPTGHFSLQYYVTDAPGFGGDLLVFKETETEVWAVHRVLDVPQQNRRERLNSTSPEDRRFITSGCVNVAPEVFEKLRTCCHDGTITIR